MDGSWHSGNENYYQEHSSSASSAGHGGPSFMDNASNIAPNEIYIPYINSYMKGTIFVPAPEAAEHSVNEALGQSGYYQAHHDVTGSYGTGYYQAHHGVTSGYGTGYYPVSHNQQQNYEHEAMIEQPHHVNTGWTHPPSQFGQGVDPNAQYGQMVHPNTQYGQMVHPNTQYGQMVHPNTQYGQMVHPNFQYGQFSGPSDHFAHGTPLLPRHDGSSNLYQHQYRHDMNYNEQEALLASQFGGMSIAQASPYASHAHDGSSSTPYAHDPSVGPADNSLPLQQQSESMNSCREIQSRYEGRSYKSMTKEEREDLDRLQTDLFRHDWSERVINEDSQTPQALADQVFLIQMKFFIGRAIKDILTSIVEPQIDPKELLYFQKKLKLLWYEYSIIRAQRPEYIRGYDFSEWAKSMRESEAGKAIEAADKTEREGGALDNADIAAREFITYLILDAPGLARISNKDMGEWLNRFLRDSPLPSGIKTREELLISLIPYLGKICSTDFANRQLRHLRPYYKKLDKAKQQEE